MKYIINTGCSYGVMFRSFKEFTKGSDNRFRIIDLHCDSHGAEYQKRSVIYTISKLKEYIDPKDIYVICEWSQPNRLFTELPKEFCEDIIRDKPHLEKTFVLDNTFNRIEENFPIELIYKYKSLSVIFDDRVYSNIEHADLDSFENKNIHYYIDRFQKNTPISYKPIDRIEQYLTNILDLQNFLKSLGIDYTFFLMNNTFEGWDDNFLHIYGDDKLNKFLTRDTIEIPNIKHLRHIKNFSSYTKQIWDLIDLSGFVFYKTNHFNHGGIDEFVMEIFGHQAYMSAANPWDIPPEGYVTSFGAHPHDSSYVTFFQQYIYNRVKHITGELTFDYTNRWAPTKHNAIRQQPNLI